MTTFINASTSSGLVVTSDNSGEFALQSNGATKAILTNAGFSYPGAIVQVVQGQTTTQITTTSTSLVDTGLSAIITPKFSTSKILVLWSHWEVYVGASVQAIGIALLRNGTILGNSQNATIGYTANAGANYLGNSNQYLDSPSTTSALTYKTQFKSHYGGGVAIQGDNTYSFITLMEIAQ